MPTRLYRLRCAEGLMGRYNATHIYKIYVIANSESSAIRSVLKPETKSIEVLSVHDFVVVD